MNNIREIEFDSELNEGAFNAVNICLGIKPANRVVIITDNDSLEIAASLIYQIELVGAEYNYFVLEDYITRPAKVMPLTILESLENADVSIYCCNTQTGELSSRIMMTDVVNRKKIRHAHMVNISKQIMLEGMRADYIKVDEISSKLIRKARTAKKIKAETKAGTKIMADFSPDIKWIKTSGIISNDKWGNLPGGEIFSSPQTINGTFVVDGVVGDYLCKKYGDLKGSPLYIEIIDGRIKSLNCNNKTLLEEFDAYTKTDENSNRVGEFAIGTNIAIKNVIGNILQDEKIPGIHIAFGHPYAEHTGQSWISKTHIDCVGRNFDIWFDDEKIMEYGEFIFDESTNKRSI